MVIWRPTSTLIAVSSQACVFHGFREVGLRLIGRTTITVIASAMVVSPRSSEARFAALSTWIVLVPPESVRLFGDFRKGARNIPDYPLAGRA